MLERFGRTFVLLFGIFIFVMGAEMTLHFTDPVTRKISASMADAIANR